MQLYLVCGSRDFTNETAIRERLRYLPVNTRVMHGDAPGADRLAARLAEERGLATIAIPADWDRWGRRAGPIRNEQMLAFKPDAVIAFKSRPRSTGTDHMIRIARAAGVMVDVWLEGRGW